MFRAENIGSMLRPQYLKDARLAHAAGTLGHAEFKRIEDRAVDEAIALQEDCGVDVVTDGEMRRSTFIGSLTDVVDGLAPVDGHTALWLTADGRIDLPIPAAVTAKLRRRRSLVAEEYAYARARAQRPLKVTVPSPLMYFPFWSPTHSTAAYDDPFEMFADAVEIVRAEVDELVALGCTYIQLDAPELATMVDPQTREWYATDRAMPAERMLTEGVDMINACVAGISGVRLGIHLSFGSSTKITALISADDIAIPGLPVTVAVFTPPPGGGLSNLASFLITNPLPTLSSLSQTVVQTGSPGFTLIVTGTNISQLAKVRFNSTELQTTFLSSTQLAGQVPGSLLGTAGKNTITIVNPAPGGGTSNGLILEVRNPSPIPRLNSLSPTSIGAGSPAFTLTINGTNFVESSIVRWNGQDLVTTFFSSNQLTAQVPINDIATPGSATITIFNPSPGGGNSNPLTFTIDPSSNPVPQIDSVSPTIISTGTPAVLTVNGSRFVPASIVHVNGSDRPTTFVSATQLTVALTADDVKSPGQLSISVFNPPPAGGTSLPVSVTVANGLPRITILDPNPVGVGGPAFNLTVNGSNFVPSSVVQAHGQNRTTTYVSSTQLIASIPASDIATVGSTTIAVVNPPPGGGDFGCCATADCLPSAGDRQPRSALRDSWWPGLPIDAQWNRVRPGLCNQDQQH